MAIDRVKPLKLESADTGGTQDDAFPTSVNQYQDYIEARGLVLADATHSDETTVIAREDADMLFKDGNNTTYVTLTQLLGGGGGLSSSTTHPLYRQWPSGKLRFRCLPRDDGYRVSDGHHLVRQGYCWKEEDCRKGHHLDRSTSNYHSLENIRRQRDTTSNCY